MSKMKLVIIEDEFFAADHLKDVVENLGHAVVGVYHSGEDFLKQTDWNFDIAHFRHLFVGRNVGLRCC